MSLAMPNLWRRRQQREQTQARSPDTCACLDGDADGAGEAALAAHLALAEPHAAGVEPVAAAVAGNHGCQ